MHTTSRQVTVWLAENIPTSLFWQGTRYTVTDKPTPLDDELYWVMHPPPARPGWRLQGTSAEGVTHMFELRESPDGWEVSRVYD